MLMWIRVLGLGFTNLVGTGIVLGVCLGYGGVCGVGGEWIWGLSQGVKGWGGVIYA